MGEAMAFRRAAVTDAAVIRNLPHEAYTKWIALIGREPNPMSADYEAAVRDHRFDLVYLDGVLAGLIETIDEGSQLLIENVAVSPAFQRRGLGAKLMAQAEAVALSLGYDQIRLYTNERFTENVRLYRKLGYVVDSQDDIGGGMMRVNMSKDLSRR